MTEPATVRRIIAIEILISTAINAVIPTSVIWLIGLRPPQRIGGMGGLLHSLTMASGIATFAMTLAVTNVVRLRRRSGALPSIPELVGPGRRLPRHLLLRALVAALSAIVLLVPIGVAIGLALRILPLGNPGFMILNIAFGTLVGVVMTPPIVRCALADPIRTRPA